MHHAKTIVACAVVMLIAAAAVADWSPDMPAKWVQLPNLTPEGMDVNATSPKVLADDFLCEEVGPITEVHVWGSWLHDVMPGEDAANVAFRLSIHSDIPVGVGGANYSMPGDLLWERHFAPGEFDVRVYADGPEGWYNPNTGEYERDADFVCWQYNFKIPEIEAFIQEGTPDQPIIYWLDVEAMPMTSFGEGMFGWKTSEQHWNDDAVWGDSPNGPWNELRHPETGESLDLAFVIVPEPATMSLLALGGLVMLRRRRR